MKRSFLVAVLTLTLLLSLVAAPMDHFAEVTDRNSDAGKLTMYFVDLDVPKGSKDKSGDCTIIISPDGKVMMVDCGHPDAGKDVLKVLHALGIGHIDIFVNSHPHIDHLGAFPQVADACSIGKVYRSALEYDTQYTRAFAASVKKYEIPEEIIADGSSFLFGEKVSVDVLWPKAGPITYPKEYPSNATQFINDTSIVLLLTYGKSKVLLGGDLYRSGERDVMNIHENELASDVAKANHHGSDTSNQRKWIKTVHPQVVVAMNDVMDSMDVYRDYVKYGSRFYHTLYNGTIKVRVDGDHHVTVIPQYESWVEKGGT